MFRPEAFFGRVGARSYSAQFHSELHPSWWTVICTRARSLPFLVRSYSPCQYIFLQYSQSSTNPCPVRLDDGRHRGAQYSREWPDEIRADEPIWAGRFRICKRLGGGHYAREFNLARKRLAASSFRPPVGCTQAEVSHLRIKHKGKGFIPVDRHHSSPQRPLEK